jgi:signal transduction histidine kinase
MPTESSAKKQGFLGRTIPLLLLSSLLGFLGVLSVDLYIEQRQVAGSTQVATSIVGIARRMGQFEATLERYHAASAVAVSDQSSSQGALVVARDGLAEAMQRFAPYLCAEDRATWESSSQRVLTLEGLPLTGKIPVAGVEDRIRALEGDLATLGRIVDHNGMVQLVKAERLHTLHGVLEASTLFALCAVSLSLLLVWRRQEARARQCAAEVEEKLRGAIRDLDNFAGRLAHDLRSPLQPILFDSQCIERAPVPATVRLQAERIERAARRLGRMVEAVLQFTRASAIGGVEREHAHAHVNSAIEAVMPELDEIAQVRGGHVAADLGPDVTLACADEVVQSLVWNLVDNAIKYGFKEGTPPHVTVRTRVENSLGVIEVEDRGPGVPPELRERVFQPLFRGHTGGEGMGLGLSIVDRVVTTLGGRVEVSAGREDGALFRILVPIEQGPFVGHPAHA